MPEAEIKIWAHRQTVFVKTPQNFGESYNFNFKPGKLSNSICFFACFTRLRDEYGTDWATIGAAMGRSASSVKDRCRLMKDTCNSGEFITLPCFNLHTAHK